MADNWPWAHKKLRTKVTYQYFRDIEVYQFKNDVINFTRSAVPYPSGHFDYFFGVSPLFAVDGNFCSKSVVWWRFHIYNNYYWCKVKIIFEWSRLIWCWWYLQPTVDCIITVGVVLFQANQYGRVLEKGHLRWLKKTLKDVISSIEFRHEI